ncbi:MULTISPECIES: transposase [unclassified Salinicola]|uniref:REP-associated tyrosine transposase n=1 Tax=unclassified Salinicola TaxID=2634022 RepID=UPI001A8E6FEC|nr:MULTISPECIES: transposase [unclassified Salinicola]MCE3026019.1 transposase [Salinicola sp. DM10]WIX34897.1 transposase [Salinicola sp. JS01]
MERYHTSHLRRGRHSEIGRIYSVTVVTCQRQAWFHDFAAGQTLAREIYLAQCQGRATSLCWVIMPDHWHWLLQLEQGDLSRLLQRVKSRSAREINRHLGRRGQVWQAGYHERALRREEDLRDVARYIVANPLRAGLTRSLADYPLWDAAWL